VKEYLEYKDLTFLTENLLKSITDNKNKIDMLITENSVISHSDMIATYKSHIINANHKIIRTVKADNEDLTTKHFMIESRVIELVKILCIKCRGYSTFNKIHKCNKCNGTGFRCKTGVKK